MAEQKNEGPRVLILGGCGFIGRNLVAYLYKNKLAAKIRVADKSMPATSYMSADLLKIYGDKDVIEFKQCDLAKDDHVKKAFADDKFDYVINLCGETRFGLSEQDYKVKNLETAKKCGAAAAAMGVSKYVEVSTAQVYDSNAEHAAEDAKTNPWTTLAKYRLAAEDELKKVQDLPLVILRPAIVYGRYDISGLTPRLACATVYQMKKEKMQFFWNEKLKINTVHIDDVLDAIWLAATKLKTGSVYNLADSSDLDQGKLGELLASIFGIKISFLGGFFSAAAAKVSLKAVAEHANDAHVPGWQKLCQQYKINNTPVSPFIDQELLQDCNLSISGSAIEKEGFKYKNPKITEDLLKEQILEHIKNNYFPAVIQ